MNTKMFQMSKVKSKTTDEAKGKQYADGKTLIIRITESSWKLQRQTLEEKGKEGAARKIMAINKAVRTVIRCSLSLSSWRNVRESVVAVRVQRNRHSPPVSRAMRCLTASFRVRAPSAWGQSPMDESLLWK